MEDHIKKIEDDILELKTSSKTGTNLVASYYYFTINQFYNIGTLFRITYGNGPQDIISYIHTSNPGLYDINYILEKPNNNTQRMVLTTSQRASGSGPTTLVIVSTRPILSVVKI